MTETNLSHALKAFDATARCGSMTAAARALNLQQPTISAHIRKLEQEFGVELLYRRGRGVALTDFGRMLLDHTRRAFSAEDDAYALLAAAKNLYVGHLHIHAVGPYNLVPILKAFSQQYPHVHITVGVADSTRITHHILNYQGDIGLVLNHSENPDLYGVPLRSQRLVIFAPVHHPLARRKSISIQDLQGQHFVLRENGSTTRKVFEKEMARHQVPVSSSLEMGSREAVREAVAQGLGLGIVAETAYMPDPRLVKIELSDSTMATQVYLICRQERSQSPLIAAFFQTSIGCVRS